MNIPKSNTRFQSRFSPLFLLLGSIVIFVVSMVLLPEYSSFTALAIKVACVIAGGVAYDVCVLRESNTYDQIIRSQNTAYAIHLGAVYIALGLAVGAL
ncbi:MAG: hypothetical protein AAFQ43_00230 [Bacteroidota bacterium]